MEHEQKIAKLKEWFINEKNADEKDFNDFLDYCKSRDILNPNATFLSKLIFSKASCERLFKEWSSPPKRAAKLLGLTYKELAEQLGYSEPGLKSAIQKDKISGPMMMTLKLLMENKKLKDENTELKNQLKNIQNVFNFLSKNN